MHAGGVRESGQLRRWVRVARCYTLDARLFAVFGILAAMCNEREIPQGVTPLTKTRPTNWRRPSGPTGPRKEICRRVVAVSSTLTILVFNTWRLLFSRIQIWRRTNTRAVPLITSDWRTTSTPDRPRTTRLRTTTSATTTSRTASITCAAKGTRGRSFTRNQSSTYRWIIHAFDRKDLI